ncbi:MAG: phosphoribosylformimino-5-aminoimidazole carboxamide ribotide isomerase [Lachnospiraceae bacterium]|nr:phosphoribosylformimino-5-aminoimidazole carboxamide ribotide isomerase [Lachnospiraceae bacterium]
MEFRPCIDIHNGQVKQIVGGTLKDAGNEAKENFVSYYDSTFYANLYKEHEIKGGHVILLNAADSEFYEKTKSEALAALRAYPGGLQVGGGIHADNAKEFLDAGASHVVVTSYVFKDGEIYYDRLKKLVETVGREKLVLDLSCRKKDGAYYIVTDRWQKFTNVKLTTETMEELSAYCDEFLIHAVDVEGKASGIDAELVELLEKCRNRNVTYAGGVHNFDDLKLLKEKGKNHIHVTIGSALDLFGGSMKFEDVIAYVREV